MCSEGAGEPGDGGGGVGGGNVIGFSGAECDGGLAAGLEVDGGVAELGEDPCCGAACGGALGVVRVSVLYSTVHVYTVL